MEPDFHLHGYSREELMAWIDHLETKVDRLQDELQQEKEKNARRTISLHREHPTGCFRRNEGRRGADCPNDCNTGGGVRDLNSIKPPRPSQTEVRGSQGHLRLQ